MSPFKPTRESATEASNPKDLGEMEANALSPDAKTSDPAAVGAKGRDRVGGAEGNRVHPPHVTANDRNAPLQAGTESPRDVAALPANAHGREEQGSSEESPPIRHTSAYENRPEEDKSNPPSDRAR